MKHCYYNGVALDYKAREYDDDYSLSDYCKRYNKDTSSTTTSTVFIEEDTMKEPCSNSIWSSLKYIFCCHW